MPKQTISDEARDKVRRLLGEGVSARAAARAAGVSHQTALNIGAALAFSGEPQPAPVVPEIVWTTDQPRPPPPLAFQRGYHDHTFRHLGAPLAFDGWNLNRVRAAISLHRQGVFLESSMLAVAILAFPPVFAALHQRMAPILELPRHVRAGARGLSRVLGAEVEAQLAPREGLSPSPYFPPTLYGATVFDLAFMGFSIWQHAYGDEDPETGVRMCYTRRWPTWATICPRYRRTFQAMTDDGGVVDVLNDGKFTLVADSDEPHLLGAIVALGEEALDGKSTQRARASYLDKYGNPKLWATMPQGVATRSVEGDAMFEAMATIRSPDGFGVLPNGAQLAFAGLTAGASTVIKDSLDSNVLFVALALLGQDGTMSSGSGGVYSSPTFRYVARTVVERDLKAIVRAANQGHVRPWLEFNYGASIAEASGWVAPVLDVPLPNPEDEARIKALSDRIETFHRIVKAEAERFEVTPERVEQLATSLGIDTPTLKQKAAEPAAQLDLAPTDVAKVVRVDEARASRNLDPIGDDRGKLMISELDKPPPGGIGAEPGVETPPEAARAPEPAPEETP